MDSQFYLFCKGQHYNDECNIFKTMKDWKAQLEKRIQKVWTIFLYFYKDHFKRNCKRPATCHHCMKEKPHNSVLYPTMLTAEEEITNSLIQE